MNKSVKEFLFSFFFAIVVVSFYSIYKYPDFFIKVGLLDSIRSIYFLDKHPSFWYATFYSLLVCSISLKVVLSKKSPYKKNKKKSKYQTYKFASIFLSQIIFFYIIPFIIPPILSGQSFFGDPTTPVHKDNYIYVFRGLTSWGGFFYIFVFIPILTWFVGKRYCSWFCACGNLAETIGVTKIGARWVKEKTPRGENAKRMEHLQTVFLLFGIFFGLVLLLDILKIVTAPNLISSLRFWQDFSVDFIFGSVIGIAAYPIWGTRVWCRYGCPLAKLMELSGKWTNSKFKVQANDKCRGIGLCTQACPMGIEVADFAFKDNKPTSGSFSLKETPCIGCGGCIDICPVDALSFD